MIKKCFMMLCVLMLICLPIGVNASEEQQETENGALRFVQPEDFGQLDHSQIFVGSVVQVSLQGAPAGERIESLEFDDPAAFKLRDDGFVPLKEGKFVVTAVLSGGDRICQTLPVRALYLYEEYRENTSPMERCSFVPEASGEYVFKGAVRQVSCDAVTLEALHTGYDRYCEAAVYELKAGKTYLVDVEAGKKATFGIEPVRYGEYEMLCPSEIHQGTTGYCSVHRTGFVAGPQPQWQWQSSDPMVLAVKTGEEDTVMLETVQPGKTVITVTSDQGHFFQREIEVYTYAIRHGLRLVKEGADLKLEPGKEKALTVVLEGDPEDLQGVRLMRMGNYEEDSAPYIPKRLLEITPGPENSDEFTLTIPYSCLSPANTASSGAYYICYEGLSPEPVSKLTIMGPEDNVMAWALAAGAVLLLAGGLVFKLRRKRAQYK